jgi:hypothetical protein
MHIYPQEYKDGIDKAIASNTSVAYISELKPCQNINENINTSATYACINNEEQTLASISDEDLYYVQSILVTSSWNKNDDVFDKIEVWNARSTPEDKPTNLEHDEDQIVGHIVSNWPISMDGSKLPDDIDIENLPDKFHIVTGSVIYRNFSNPELNARAEELIQQIKDGKKYVSMECYFNNFDYGLLNNNNGEYHIVSRNENSAYLTKHLRAYGGAGEFENYKIGRVLRNINFSGKGFVDKPANPESIIFAPEQTNKLLQKNKNIHLENNSVCNIQASLNMENTNMSLEKDISDLKDKVEAMNGCSESLKEAYSTVTSLETKVMELESSIKDKDEAMISLSTQKTELDNALAAKDAELEEYKKKMQYDVAQLDEAKASEIEAIQKDHAEAFKSIQDELASANETIEAYKIREAELAKQALIASRISQLVQTGVTEDIAAATVNRFESLDDEAFSAITALVGSNTPEWAQSQTEQTASEDTEASTEEEVTESIANETEAATESDLDNVEVEESIDLSVGSEDDSELQTTRASLVDFVYSRLGKKEHSIKGE